MLILMELGDDFKKLGYKIKIPDNCFQTTTNPPPENVGFSIIGLVGEIQSENEIYVNLLVEEQMARAVDVIKNITGIKMAIIPRDQHERLGEEIIKYIKERFESNE